MTRRGWLLFALMSVIWGIPYLFIKIALEGVSAPFLVLSRTAIGAAILLPIAWRRGMIRPALRAWQPLNDAEQHISSSLAGLLIAAVPLVSTLVTWRLGDHSALDPRRLLGLLVGMAGVAAVVGLDVGSTSALRMGEVLLVAVGYAVAPIIADRKLKQVPTLAVISLSLTGVALAYIPAAIVTRPRVMPHANVIGAVLTLGLICTAAAFLLFFQLIAEAGPVRATVITFINPAVAVLLGMLVLGEHFTAGVGVGFPLVLIGSWLSTRKSAPREKLRERIPVIEGEVAARQ